MNSPAEQHIAGSTSGHMRPAYWSGGLSIEAEIEPTISGSLPDAGSWNFGFGPYRVSVSQRALLRHGARVKLGERAFDLLVALASQRGQVISQRELIAMVWDKTVVEESSVRVQMGHLRRAIGDGSSGVRYIATLPGRGYCFVAPVEAGSDESSRLSDGRHPAAVSTSAWPLPGTPLIGRDEEVQAVLERIGQRQHLTLTGPRGIGKSSLAFEAARRIAPLFREGYKIVDVGQLPSWTEVMGVVRAEMDRPARGAVAAPHQVLLLLDNCDEYLEEAAALVREVCAARKDLQFLVTACRALPGMEDASLAVRPLRIPPATTSLCAIAAVGFPAIQLFVQEVLLRFPAFKIDDADAALIARACVRLGGMPSAIKLAAAWVGYVPLSALPVLIGLDLEAM